MSSGAWIRILFLLSMFFYTKFKMAQIFKLQEPAAWLLSFGIFVVIIAWMFTYRYDVFKFNGLPFKIVMWTGSSLMALWATFMICMIFVDVAFLVVLAVEKIFAVQAFEPERRAFFAQWIPAAALGASALMVGAGMRQAAKGAQVKNVKVVSPKISKNLESLKIVQISDLHVGPTIQVEYVQSMVDKIMTLNPDIIAVTGDMVDGTPEQLEEALAPLGQLKAPHGVYYITGNHEYYWGAERWAQKARDMGFTVLLNENKVIDFKGTPVMIAGITDPSSEQFVPTHKSDAIAAAKSSTISDYKILLAHRPESYEDAEKAGFDLQLSGHTHSGQFFPASLFISFFHRYYRGLNRHNDLHIYVNVGSGYWGPADRFTLPAEITLLEFAST